MPRLRLHGVAMGQARARPLRPGRADVTPTVLNRRDPKAEGFYVGRPSKYGNPFVVGRHGTREQVIAKYRAWLCDQPGLIEDAKNELRGCDLICWCAPLPCHADVLLEVANEWA